MIERAVILAKVESSYGQDATPGVTEAIVTSVPSITINGEKVERLASGPSMSPWPHVIGRRDIELSFDVDLRGAGSAYSASNLPEISALMRACGFAETVDTTPGSEKVVYDPVSSGFESCSIYYYDDGYLYKALGCRGDVEFLLEAGKLGIVKFKFGAVYTAPADQALIAPTYKDLTVIPPAFFSGSLSLGGYSPVASKLELKIANALGKRVDANSADGVKEIFISGRKPAGSLDPEAVALSTKNVFTEWKDGTAQAILATLGGTQYNRVKFSAPKARYDSVGLADREKLRTWELPFACDMDSGDDELVVTFD